MVKIAAYLSVIVLLLAVEATQNKGQMSKLVVSVNLKFE